MLSSITICYHNGCWSRTLPLHESSSCSPAGTVHVIPCPTGTEYSVKSPGKPLQALVTQSCHVLVSTQALRHTRPKAPVKSNQVQSLSSSAVHRVCRALRYMTRHVLVVYAGVQAGMCAAIPGATASA